jgi:hypothetical protein
MRASGEHARRLATVTTATDIDTTITDQAHAKGVRRWVDVALVSVGAVAIAGCYSLGSST